MKISLILSPSRNQFWIWITLIMHSSPAALLQQHCFTACVCTSDLKSITCDTIPLVEYPNPDVRNLQIKRKHFKFHSSKLSMFPNLESLEFFNLHPTDLTSNEFKFLPNLRNVTLHGSRLYYIDPLLFENNKNLVSVNLSSNPLTIQEEFLISDTIKEVDLSSCNLSTLPLHSFNKLQNLQRIYLRGNGLINLSQLVWPPNLRFLDIAENNFQQIPENIQSLKSLHAVDVDKNPLKCSCDLKSIESNMLKQNITIIKPILCSYEKQDALLIKNLSQIICQQREKGVISHTFGTKLSEPRRISRAVSLVEKKRMLAVESDIEGKQYESMSTVKITIIDPEKAKFQDDEYGSENDSEEDETDMKLKLSENAAAEESDEKIVNVFSPGKTVIVPEYVMIILCVVISLVAVLACVIICIVCCVAIKVPPEPNETECSTKLCSIRKNNGGCNSAETVELICDSSRQRKRDI